MIGPGVDVINRSLELKEMSNVILRGRPGAVLKLAPLQHAEVASDVAVGATSSGAGADAYLSRCAAEIAGAIIAAGVLFVSGLLILCLR